MAKITKMKLFFMFFLPFFWILPALADEPVSESLIQLSSAEEDWIKKNLVIRVANEDDWPPFDFSEQGKPLGYSIDIADLVAEKIGLKFEFINGYTWSDLYKMALAGKIDLLPCIGKSPERERDFLLTKSYFDDPIVVFVRKDAPPFRNMRDLLDKRLAVIQDYSVTDNIKTNYPDIRLAHVPSPAAALRAVSEGRVDAFAGTMSVGNYEIITKGIPNVRIGGRADIKGMGDSAFYMAIPKSMPILASLVQKGLDGITKDEQHRLLRKWEIISTSTDKPAFNLSDEEKTWLAGIDELILGIHSGASPYSFINDQGIYSGLSADLIKSMSKRLGISIKPINGREWGHVLSGMKAGTIDIIAFGQKRLHEKNDERVTQPYMQDPIVIITREDARQVTGLNELKGKKVGYTKLQLLPEYIHRDYPALKLVDYPSLKKALISLDKKEIDALLSTITAFEYHRRRIDVKSLKIVATTPLSFKPAFEVRKGLEPIVEILNKYIATVGDEQINALAQGWKNVQVEKQVDLKMVLLVIVLVSFIGLIIVFFFAYANRRLSEEIKERIKVEEELKANESFLNSVVDNIPNMIFVKDADELKFVRFNKAGEELLGYPRKSLIGKNDYDFFPQKDAEFFTDKDRKVLFDKELLDIPEEKIQTKDRGTRILHTKKIPILDENENPIFLLGISEDITGKKQALEEKKAMEEQLRQANKMEAIGTLAGGIAHDFNNILFPILGYSEMLLDDVSIDSPIHDSLNKIYTGALRAKDLVKQILTFSRQEKSDLKLMKIQPIVKEALKFIRSTIPTTIDIEQEIQADSVVVKADPTQIHQVIMNLSTNAYHAMEKTGGKLKVSLKEIELGEYDVINPDMTPGDYACLKIADTGTGMDKDLTKKIFDPFFTTKEKGKGTGMGLSVVHGIVTGMSGAIQIYSEPGQGTEFTVYLPVEKSSSEELKEQVKQPIQGGSEHILLVDDEEAIITMEKQMLERLGYKVTSRTSSIEACEAFRENPDKFDLIITDMAMPNLPGDKLAVELIKIRHDIPILLCTGFSENMPQGKAAFSVIKNFLFKPIVMKDLAQKIREVIDKKNADTTNCTLKNN